MTGLKPRLSGGFVQCAIAIAVVALPLPRYFFKKMDQTLTSDSATSLIARPIFFCLFSFFSHDKYSTNLTINDKSVHGVLGTQTGSSRMVGAGESAELCFTYYMHNTMFVFSYTFESHVTQHANLTKVFKSKDWWNINLHRNRLLL